MHEATILRSTPYGCYIGLSTSLWSIGIERETKTEIPNTFVKVYIHHLKEMGHFKQFKKSRDANYFTTTNRCESNSQNHVSSRVGVIKQKIDPLSFSANSTTVSSPKGGVALQLPIQVDACSGMSATRTSGSYQVLPASQPCTQRMDKAGNDDMWGKKGEGKVGAPFATRPAWPCLVPNPSQRRLDKVP